ncbi:MAG: vitamin B12 dependent-methionine synthase activation domain-containing protein, partial [Anaerolineae bacterium]
ARKRYEELEEAGEVSEAYFVHGLASQAAEATAEFVHRRIRRELDLPDKRSKRYSWGYPPCPDVTQHRLLFKLLPAQTALGMSITPAGQLIPEHSTAALVVHHPEARYFVVQ